MSTIKIFDQKGGYSAFFGTPFKKQENKSADLSFFDKEKSKEIVSILENIKKQPLGINKGIEINTETNINTIYTLLDIALELSKGGNVTDDQLTQLGGIVKYLSAIVFNSLDKNILDTKDLKEAQEEYKKELREALDLIPGKQTNISASRLNKDRIKKEVSEAQIKLAALKPEIQKVNELQKLSNEDKKILKNKLNETYKSIKTITNYIIDVYEDEYKVKYLKYKEKYINLKKELEAGSTSSSKKSPRKKGIKPVTDAENQVKKQMEKKLLSDENKEKSEKMAKGKAIHYAESNYQTAYENLKKQLETPSSDEDLKDLIENLIDKTNILISKTQYNNIKDLKEREEATIELERLKNTLSLKRTIIVGSDRKTIRKDISKLNKEMKDIIKINKKQEKDEENLEKSDKEKVTLSEKYKNILSATQNLAKALID